MPEREVGDGSLGMINNTAPGGNALNKIRLQLNNSREAMNQMGGFNGRNESTSYETCEHPHSPNDPSPC
jgi:hypothetical protein